MTRIYLIQLSICTESPLKSHTLPSISIIFKCLWCTFYYFLLNTLPWDTSIIVHWKPHHQIAKKKHKMLCIYDESNKADFTHLLRHLLIFARTLARKLNNLLSTRYVWHFCPLFSMYGVSNLIYRLLLLLLLVTQKVSQASRQRNIIFYYKSIAIIRLLL